MELPVVGLGPLDADLDPVRGPEDGKGALREVCGVEALEPGRAQRLPRQDAVGERPPGGEKAGAAKARTEFRMPMANAAKLMNRRYGNMTRASSVVRASLSGWS